MLGPGLRVAYSRGWLSLAQGVAGSDIGVAGGGDCFRLLPGPAFDGWEEVIVVDGQNGIQTRKDQSNWLGGAAPAND